MRIIKYDSSNCLDVDWRTTNCSGFYESVFSLQSSFISRECGSRIRFIHSLSHAVYKIILILLMLWCTKLVFAKFTLICCVLHGSYFVVANMLTMFGRHLWECVAKSVCSYILIPRSHLNESKLSIIFGYHSTLQFYSIHTLTSHICTHKPLTRSETIIIETAECEIKLRIKIENKAQNTLNVATKAPNLKQ